MIRVLLCLSCPAFMNTVITVNIVKIVFSKLINYNGMLCEAVHLYTFELV